MVVAFFIPISCKESRVRKNMKRHLNNGPFCGVEIAPRALHMLNRHPTCLSSIGCMIHFKNKYLGTQEPPHSLISYPRLPAAALGRVELDGAGSGGAFCLGSAVNVTLYPSPSILALLMWSLCSLRLFSLNFEVSFNVTTLGSCHLLSDCQGTLSGPACSFIINPDPCHHAV